MKTISNQLLKYSVEKLESEIKCLDSKLKAISKLKERKETLDSLVQQAKNSSNGSEMKKYIDETLTAELKTVESKLSKFDEIKKSHTELTEYCNQLKKK